MKKITLLILLTKISFASSAVICQTPRKSRSILIENGQISFLRNGEISARNVASLKNSSNFSLPKKFKKSIRSEGSVYTIYINNTKSFSEVDDYVTIKNNKGHEITYSLNCSNRHQI